MSTLDTDSANPCEPTAGWAVRNRPWTTSADTILEDSRARPVPTPTSSAPIGAGRRRGRRRPDRNRLQLGLGELRHHRGQRRHVDYVQLPGDPASGLPDEPDPRRAPGRPAACLLYTSP